MTAGLLEELHEYYQYRYALKLELYFFTFYVKLMRQSNYRSAVIQDLTPPWTRSIAYSKEWETALQSVLPLEHIILKEYKHDEGGDHDALYLASSAIPAQVHDFIALFNKLAPGGLALLEWEAKKWSYSEMKKIADSMGADLLFFGAAHSYRSHLKSADKIAVLQKRVFLNEKKKLSILIPIFSALKDNPRALQWLQFIEAMDLVPFVELLLIFDGIHDALPAWKECEALEEERGFQMLRHYRSFGKAECMRSAFYFARGRYLLWDEPLLPCFEFFSIFEQLPKENVQSPLGIFAKAWGSDAKNAKRLGPASPVPFFLLNRSAAELLYRQNTHKQEVYSNDSKDKDRELLTQIQNTLKKEKAAVSYVNLTAYPAS